LNFERVLGLFDFDTGGSFDRFYNRLLDWITFDTEEIFGACAIALRDLFPSRSITEGAFYKFARAVNNKSIFLLAIEAPCQWSEGGFFGDSVLSWSRVNDAAKL
jgi:hypothetical protein